MTGAKRYSDIARALSDELRELESRAGIRERAERIADLSGPFIPTPIANKTPAFSAKFAEEVAADNLEADRIFGHQIRKLYFSVADTELRKLLIQKFREIEQNGRELVVAESQDARSAIAKAHRLYNWTIEAALTSSLAVAAGWGAFGTPGAIGAAVIAVFLGFRCRDAAHDRRAEDIEEAERNLREAEAVERRVFDEGFAFSSPEAETGEPEDLLPRLRSVG